MQLNSELNTTAANEHVPEVDRLVVQEVIKEECAHGYVTTSSFTLIPDQLKIHLIHYVIQMLNQMASRTFLSPAAIITRMQLLDVKQHYQVPFGAYCQIVHEESSPTNRITEPPTIGSIALRPTRPCPRHCPCKSCSCVTSPPTAIP